jgi:hypothetical protein
VDDYLGIVVRESLRDPARTPPVVASRPGAEWTLLLVRVPAEDLDHEVEALRSNLVHTDCWYAHFFRKDELVVVFDDEVFAVSTDPSTWDAAVRHGRVRGVPDDELDFSPNTISGVEQEFGVRIQ